MKKYLFSFAAIAAILAGCAKEAYTEIQNPSKKEGSLVVLHASVPDTRVSTDNVGAFKWQVGDMVTVLNTSGTPYEFSTEEGGTSVDFGSTTFTGELSTEAMYPSSSNHTSGKFYLEPSFAWAQDLSLMPMVGTVNTSTRTASFKSVGAVLKLVCYNVDADARKFVVSSDTKKLNGEFTPSGSPKAIATASKGASDNSVTITFGSGHPSNMVFYIPLPTGDLGKLTFVMRDGSDVNVSDAKETKGNVVLERNQIVAVPALNCAKTIVLWSEDFSGYLADNVPSGKVGDVTYTCTDGDSETKIWAESSAGGSSPELLVGKKKTSPAVAGGTFVISDIPTGGAGKMNLSFKLNKSLKLSATSGITLSKTTISGSSARTESVTLTNTGDLDKFDLTFFCDYTSNCRLDDIVLTAAPAAYTAPSITPDEDALTIAVGATTATTDFTFANKVDEMNVAALVNEEAKSWLSAAITGTYPDYTLTVTASGEHSGVADRVGTVTLRASGVSKTIAVTQKTKLVPNPTLSVTPGDARFSASWTADEHATGFVAYLRTSEGTPTDGTNITSSISNSGSAYSITDYTSGITNGTTYYLYVKVNTVSSGYEAPSEYVMKSFTPATAKGTSSNPYTVAEALEIIAGYSSGTGGASSVYTSGIISSVSKLESDNSITYFISDDGTATDELKVYKGKDVGNTTFSAVTDLEAGDIVVIYGQLFNYSGTAEINSGNYLYSLTKPHIVTLTPNTDILMGGDANNVYSMTVKTNYAWTAELNAAATSARGVNYDVLNASDVVIDGVISGSAGTTTLKFKAKGDGNGDGSTVTNYGTITFSDGTASSTKIIKQSPKVAKTNQVLFHETFGNNTGSARAWNDSYSVKSGVTAVYSGITGYTVSNAKQGKNTTGSTQSGLNQTTSGTDAYIIIGPLAVSTAENMVLTYQWKAASIKETYSTSLYYATSSGGVYTEVSGTGAGATSFVEREYSLPAAAQVSTLYLKIVWNTSNTSAIIDEVNLQGDY